MRDGMYKVTLAAGGIKGLIIGALRGNRMTGCDQTHFVTGTVKRDGNRVSGTFRLTRHSRHADFQEIANLDDFEVRFTGIGSDSFGEFESEILGKPGLTVKSTFRWISEI